jgi:hypothetical protein
MVRSVVIRGVIEMFRKPFWIVLCLGIIAGAVRNVSAAGHETGQDAIKRQTVKGGPVTRGRVAQMIYDAFSSQLDKTVRALPRQSPYRDVTAKDPNYRAIIILTRHNVATGDVHGDFHPTDSVSRYELAQALERLIGALKPKGIDALLAAHLDMPKDISQDNEAYGAVERMIKLGVVVPFTDSYFRGKRPTTDAEVADALIRIKELSASVGRAKTTGN